MITTTYGYKKPQDGDTGAPVFSALNANTDLVVAHAHNGSDSAAIASSNLSKGTSTLSSGGWVAASAPNSGWKQTVTMPGVYTLANCTLRFRVTSGANQHKIIHPTIIPASATVFDVIVNDNSLNLEILYV